MTLLANGSEVLWIEGIGVSESAKVKLEKIEDIISCTEEGICSSSFCARKEKHCLKKIVIINKEEF